ncbi:MULTISPECIES: hypothetical protein [unclassified Methanoculleus]|uniref:hypothetical protein n=1 Tax=unclassified Methanoculleus TaxID=2619537 RepID=UPI0025E0F208|nr:MULTISPECIES: hypothetical protein [unclassified Methanoculleus]MCK9316855.1 hypothetical protein [Methanoculleus sp.]MDD2253917.1 hypothetical protein [Methanoculleus sp.]MDD2786900.1 hypothetical protein [Methanoculleus sp.]MDD3215060.1 hypothetical protein [Methanoculleus sp.]MDD4313073.1 hypothetical protein [Methanoculleus sp.]
MKIDTIAKEELWRSVATFGVSLIVTAFIITTDYLPLPSFLLLPLPLTIAAVVACVMVWYRRKEGLNDPSPANILRHALRLGKHEERKTARRRGIVEKVIDAALLVTVFLIYLYASLAYSINQILWLPVLLIVALLLTRIIFTDGGERRVTFTQGVVFYLGAAGIVLLRHLALGHPVLPLLRGIALVGIVAFPIHYVWERRRTPEGTD